MPKFSGQPNGSLCPCCGALYEGETHGGVVQCPACGVFFTVPKTRSLAAIDLLDRGKALLCRGEFNEANALFTQVTSEDAREPEGHFLSALAAARIRIVPDRSHTEGGYHLALHGQGKLSQGESFAQALTLATERQKSMYRAYAEEAAAEDAEFRRLRRKSPSDAVVLFEEGDERALSLVRRLRAAGRNVVTNEAGVRDARLRCGLATAPCLVIFFKEGWTPWLYGDTVRYLAFSPAGRCGESVAAVFSSEELLQAGAPSSFKEECFPIDGSTDCVGRAEAFVREALEKKRRLAEAEERKKQEQERELKRFQRKERAKERRRSFFRSLGSAFVRAGKAVPAFFVRCFRSLHEKRRGTQIILWTIAVLQFVLALLLTLFAALYPEGLPLALAQTAMGFIYAFSILFALCYFLAFGLQGLLGLCVGAIISCGLQLVCVFIAPYAGGLDIWLWICVGFGIPVSSLASYAARNITFKNGGSSPFRLGAVLAVFVYALCIATMARSKVLAEPSEAAAVVCTVEAEEKIPPQPRIFI